MPNLPQTTDPWNNGQFIVIDDFRCVYTTKNDEYLVRLPGGRAETINKLRARGYKVRLPSMPRREFSPLAKTLNN